MDEGYRLLQAHSLRDSLTFPVIVQYPGIENLGSIAEDVRPLPAHYGRMAGNGIVCFYSPALALIASIFSGKGFLLVPLISGFFLWYVLSKKLFDSGFSKVQAELLPLIGTPLLFLSLGFWSYPLCILVILLALKYTEKKKLFAAYALVAIAALFRIEFALTFIIVFLRSDGNWFKRIIPVLPALILLFAGNWLFNGHGILGSHVLASTSEQALYGDTGSSVIFQKLVASSRALLAMTPGQTKIIWVIPGLFLWLLWGLALRGGKVGYTASLLGLSLCLVSCIFWALGQFAFLDAFTMKHPLMVFPILWLFSPNTLKKSGPELLVMLILIALLLPMHTEGPHWGVRHLFLPLFLMIWNLKPFDKGVLPVMLFGFLFTLSALLFLGTNRSRVVDLNQKIKDEAGAIVTTNWIIPGWLTDSMAEGIPVVYAGNSDNLNEAMSRLRERKPVVICLYRDALHTIRILEELGYTCSIAGEVQFGSSMKCILLLPN